MEVKLTLAGPFNYKSTRKPKVRSCGSNTYYEYSGQTLTEPDGTKHHFAPDPYVDVANVCSGYPAPTRLYSDDGSGWVAVVVSGTVQYYIRKDGTKVYTSYDPTSQCGAGLAGKLIEDSNGNQLLVPCSDSPSGTDTLGRSVPTNGSYNDSSGVLRNLTVQTTSVAIQTDVCIGSLNDTCHEYSGTWTVPNVIQLPNGMTYTFTYAQNSHGEPLSLSLPTGGTISWTWDPPSDSGGKNVKTRTHTGNGQSAVWQYGETSTCCFAKYVTVTDPLLNDTRIKCDYFGEDPRAGSCQVTVTEQYSGSSTSGQLLKSVTTDYQVGPGGSGTSATRVPIRDTTTWPTQNLVSKVETDWYFYDWDPSSVSAGAFTWRNLKERREYGFGTGAPGALIRKTTYNYQHLLYPTYRDANIADRQTSQIVIDGSTSATVAQLETIYDGGSLLTAPGAASHNSTYTTSYTLRGNPTTARRWLDKTNSWLLTTNIYDEVGNLRSTTDPGDTSGIRHTTTFSYSDNFANSLCVPAGTTTHGYVTQVTNHLGHRLQKTYFPCTGLLQATKDENDIASGRPGKTYTYDLMNRPFDISFTDPQSQASTYIQTSLRYTDTAPLSITRTDKITASKNLTNISVLNDFGRIRQTKQSVPINECATGFVLTDTTYDPLGRKSTVSNPYCTTSDPTYGVTTYKYDPLDRVTKVIPPDGTEGANNITTTYDANITTVTDQAGKQRRTYMDALGRVTRVDEPGNGVLP